MPGDSLLFTAGLLASEGYFSLSLLIVLSFVAAVIGDSVGYYTGKKMGKYIFIKEESFFFSKKNLQKSTEFYAKHGPKTIILARFIPVVRTFAPILAGTSGMPYKKFFSFNIIGGILWTVTMPTLGYFLGNSVEDIDKYLLPIVFGIIIVSFIPVFWQLYKAQRIEKKIKEL